MSSPRFLALVGLSLSSCVVWRAEGDQMQADLERLKSEVVTLQRKYSDAEQTTGRRLNDLSSQYDQLSNASTTILKSGAETGMTTDKLMEEINSLRGNIEELQHQIQQGGSPSAVPSVPMSAPKESGHSEAPEGKQAHFDWAKKLYDHKKYEQAANGFDQYIEKYKQDKTLLSSAYFWRAESYSQLAQHAEGEAAKKELYKKAILSYQRVLTDFPNSSKVDVSLFKVGEALETLGFPKDAKVFFSELIEKHPKSSLVKQAKKRLELIEKKNG